MFKNVASQKLIVYAFDSTTNLPKTGDAANLTAYVSKDYGSVTVLGDTSATEMDSTNAKGYYLFDLTQGETNGDTLLFSAKSGTANIVVLGMPASVFTTPPNFTTLSIDSSGRAKSDVDTIKTQTVTCAAGVTVNVNVGTTQPVNFTGTGASALAKSDMVDIAGAAVSTSTVQLGVSVRDWMGDTIPARNVTGVPKVDVVDHLGSAPNALISGRYDVNVQAMANAVIAAATLAADTITAAKIATDAIGADELAADGTAEIAAAVFARAFNAANGSYTFDQMVKMFAAALLSKVSGGGTSTVVFRNPADSADVITATVDANGNRSAVTLAP